MPVEKEYSIVADSTISSSPHLEDHVRDGDHDASTVPIKRPPRTYGRRREEPLVEEAESLHSTSSSLNPHNTARNTAPLEVVPSSSPRFTRSVPHHGASDDEEASSASPKFVFDWKKKLEQMDEDDDDGAVNASAIIKENDVPTRASFGQPSLLQHSSIVPFHSDTSSEGQISQSLPIISHDLFGDDCVSQENGSSPQVAPAKEMFSLSSPQVAPRARARLSNVIHDSDSEPEPSKASSSTTPSSSSQPLHNINTPKSRSLSTTPPTSEDEMPAKISTNALSSRKRKSLGHSRPSAPPLDLIERPLSEPKIRSGTKNHSKVKAPTKKDRQEMLKERTRLAAGSTVSIPRETVSKYTVEGLFAKIRCPDKQLTISAPTLEPLTLSDPIEAYSSPPANPGREVSRRVASTSYLARTKVSTSNDPHSPTGNDSDSEDLPEVSEVIKEIEVQKKKQELQEMKKRAIEMLQSKSMPEHLQVDSDDDDLQIVNSNAKTGVKEEEGRRSAKKQHISQTRKQQMQLARVNPTKQKRNEEASLLMAHGNGEGPSSIVLQHSARLGQTELSRVMAAQAQIQAREVSQRKANEWKKHGGHLPAQLQVPAEGLVTALQTIAERGMKAAEASAANRMDVDDDDDDEDDEDWDPTLRGSASPEPVENDGEEDEEENDENMSIEQDITMVENNDSEEVEEAKVRATRRMVVVSDDENDNEENIPPASSRYRRATSSVELPTEDEYDKENNTELMYDRSDDKENTAVVRHTPLASSSRSIFDIVPPLSPDGVSRELNFRSQRVDIDSEGSGKLRRPFKDLLSDESPSSIQHGPSTLTQSFAAQLQQASPLPSTLSPTRTLKSFIGVGLTSDKSFSGYSQISESSDLGVFVAAPLLAPGFSDLFESTTQKQRSPTRSNKGKARAMVDEEAHYDYGNPRIVEHSDALDLTQDVSVAVNLQPAFQVGENLMRKADAIFEQEQAYVVESALHKPFKKPELYVNNHGFLTQTKPTDGTPELYRSQPAFAGDILHGSMLSPSQSRPRAPLRTLSISSTYQADSPERQPLRRLRKNVQRCPGSDSVLNSPTTPPPKKNAFDLLARGAAKAQKRDEKKQKRPNVDLSEFLENEAAESDEENNRFGMVIRKADDEENEEDLDQTLDVLMDDKEMDEETFAAERVLEKYKEQEEEQDKKDQELHEAAISGRLRLKRNRGVGIDDSDEESDDDDNERARRAMKKLRSSDRGDIKDLEANEATRPFAETYIQSLKDDDEELSYLAVEASFDDLLGDNKASYESELEDDAEEDVEEENETISPEEIRRRARQMIEEGVEEPQIDPLDVSWVDKDPENDAPRVKAVRPRQRGPVPRNDMDSLELDGSMLPFGKPADQFSASSKQWCAQENKSRNAGTSRSVGGSAITGHTKAKARTATGTIHKGPMKKTESASASGNQSLRSERSMLSAIVDKRRHFG